MAVGSVERGSPQIPEDSRVISIYLLTQGRELLAAARRLFPGHTHLFDFTLVAGGSTLGAYVRGQLLISALMGTYIGVSLMLLGVPYAVLLGLVAALLEFDRQPIGA